MKVAIDISPLYSVHKTRGVGFYTKRLVETLRKITTKDPRYRNWQIKLIRNARYARFLRNGKLEIGNFDLIHYPYFDLFWLTLPLRKPKPTVVTVHDLIPLVFPDKFPKGIKGWIKYQIQKQSLKGAKAIITDSENSKKDIIKFTDFPKDRIYVIYLAPGKEFKKLENPATRDSFGMGNWKLEIREKYQLPETFLLYVGDVNYSKNILGLVKAFSNLKPQNSNLKLILVGKAFKDETLPETKEIIQLIKVLKLKDFVKILGFVSDKDLVAIYNLATVYCQPSFYEGFGLPVLEAMACGTPVVAANTSSLPEICGDAAIMVNPYKIEDIARKIKKVISDKIIRGRLVEKGLAQAKKFSWEKTAKETIKVYHEVFKRK